jgi:hypothetical protein
MTKDANTAAAPAPVENSANAAPAATENQQPIVTINDLVLIVNFLQELSNMRRLSEPEVAHLKPSFDRVVTFLTAHQQAQTTANAAADPVTQSEDNLLELPEGKGKGKGKKKSSKKK